MTHNPQDPLTAEDRAFCRSLHPMECDDVVPRLMNIVDRLVARVRELEAKLLEVWESVPATYDDADPLADRHAQALNAIGKDRIVAAELDRREAARRGTP